MATLKEIRKFIGLTQQELADQAGIHVSQVRKYESGELSMDNMTAKTAAGISKALGCTMEELMDLNLNIFTEDARLSVRSGDLTLKDIMRMDKRKKVMALSKIGPFEATFQANYSRIPEGLFDKLQPADLAAVVDAFYQAYSDGKNAS